MVRTFKCLTCRGRKVKCDERRPVCQPCEIGGRLCTYPTRDPSVFSIQPLTGGANLSTARGSSDISDVNVQDRSQGLQLLSAKSMPGGFALVQVFAPIQETRKRSRHQLLMPKPSSSATSSEERRVHLPSPRCTLTSPQTRLLSRWAAMMSSTTSTSYPLQAFSLRIQMFPPRIGSTTTLDLAILYFIETGEVFRRRRGLTSTSAAIDGERALKSLRTAMSSHKFDDTTLLAISLHVFAEVFITLGSFHYMAHIRALSQILNSRIASISCIENDLDFMLVNSTLLEEITDSMRHGRDCVYDRKAATLPTPLRSMHRGALDVAFTALMQNFVRLPRLARLVRECTISPMQSDLRLEAIELAENLYNSTNDDAIGRGVGEVVQMPTTTPQVAQIFKQSFQYESIEHYALAIRFQAYRLTLAGILQTLQCTYSSTSRFDLNTLECQDTEAATMIAMSVDYALTVDKSLPLAALRMIAPLQYSFYAWYRLSKRHGGSPRGMYGLRMQEWTLGISNGLVKAWNGPQDSLESICTRAEAYAAGPISSDLHWKFEFAGQ